MIKILFARPKRIKSALLLARFLQKSPRRKSKKSGFSPAFLHYIIYHMFSSMYSSIQARSVASASWMETLLTCAPAASK